MVAPGRFLFCYNKNMKKDICTPYADNGYIDFPKIRRICDENNIYFVFIVGGRGTGKTYGALLELAIKNPDDKFMFIRRQQNQVNAIRKPDFSPFKKICSDYDITVGVEPVVENVSKFVYDDNTIGYLAALATFSNVRGFDGSDISNIIYDEFIPERHERPIKAEADALFNLFETINRNRELNHEKPARLWCLANANDLGNPVFMSLKLVTVAERMREAGREIYMDKKRGYMIILLDRSPISEQKKETVLYKLTTGSDFEKMSIDNDFVQAEIMNIKSKKLKEYKPLVKVGEIVVYKHKSAKQYYVTTHASGSYEDMGNGEISYKRFNSKYYYLWNAYFDLRITFENYYVERLFVNICKT